MAKDYVVHRKRGVKPKKPTTALNAMYLKHGITTYWLQKNGIISSGYVHNVARRNVKSYSIQLLMRLSKPLHMDWAELGKQLLKLQKKYPPKHKRDRRSPNTKAYKNEKADHKK